MTQRAVIVGATGAWHPGSLPQECAGPLGWADAVVYLAVGPLGQQAALSSRDHGVRTVVLRTGYVLTRDSLASHAPEPAQARQFARSPGHVASHRAWLPVPTPLVRMGLGEVTDILVRGKRVIPAKASAVRYQFTFPVLETALHNLVPGGPGA